VRHLGLDIGSARVGVAVSDAAGVVATPLKVLDARELERDTRLLARIVDDYEVDVLVVGLPLTLSGEEGPQAREVRAQAGRLSEAVGVPVRFWDERLSTSEAEQSLRQGDASAERRRAARDMIAAALVLQAYLDANREARDDLDG
jgi:putative Holliday junction resolvase